MTSVIVCRVLRPAQTVVITDINNDARLQICCIINCGHVNF